MSVGFDCGLFAIAFATALCNGVDPHGLSLDQGAMREHLVGCFEEGEMLPEEFPEDGLSEWRRLQCTAVADCLGTVWTLHLVVWPSAGSANSGFMNFVRTFLSKYF